MNWFVVQSESRSVFVQAKDLGSAQGIAGVAKLKGIVGEAKQAPPTGTQVYIEVPPVVFTEKQGKEAEPSDVKRWKERAKFNYITRLCS